MKNDKKRILIFNVNWIGDVIFSTPFIRSLREAYKDSFIACAVPPRCVQILDSNPHIDEIIVYDEQGRHASIIGKIKFISDLKKRKFDTALILHRSFTRALLAYLAGIKERVGYHTNKRALLLTKAIEPPDAPIHKVDYFLNIATGLGLKGYNEHCEFYFRDTDKNYINELLGKAGIRENDVLILLSPGGNWDPKRWPKENFSALADRLIEAFGAKVIISCAGSDKGLADMIYSMIKRKENVINLAGRTDLKQLGALFKRVNLVIANDTGPMHIAVAVGAPAVALFGPTNPGITGPYGKGRYAVISKTKECAVPCYNLSCVNNVCMQLISVSDVMGEAKKMLGRI